MSPKQLRLLRVSLFLGIWLLMVVIAVLPVRAQGGEGIPAGESVPAGETVSTSEIPPDDLNDVAVRLAPLLIGAALIERAIELIFNWAERAMLDVTHSLHGLTARVTGIVQVDLHEAWDDLQRVSSALMNKEVAASEIDDGDPDSPDPNDWPLFVLEERLVVARQALEAAQTTVDQTLSSPAFIARKKMAAAWISMILGIALAAVSNLRVFEPLGVDIAPWFDGPFEVLDLILAGALMGLGTEWVHQLIGVIIQGKGLLGRAAQGSQLSVDQVRDLAMVAVQEAFSQQVDAVSADLAQGLDSVTSSDLRASRAMAGAAVAGSAVRSASTHSETEEASGMAAHGYSGDADQPVFKSSLADFEEELTEAEEAADLATPAPETFPQNLPPNLPTDLPQRAPETLPEDFSQDFSQDSSSAALPAAGIAAAAALAAARVTEPDRTAEPEATSDLDTLLADLDDLDDLLPLENVAVRVRPGGANIHAEPDQASDKLGRAAAGDTLGAQGLVWGEQTWLQTPWDTPTRSTLPAWVAEASTDFARSSAYNQVVRAWYDTEPVLRFRRSLVRDILKIRKASAEQLASIESLAPADLRAMEESLTKHTMLPDYVAFWEHAEALGLPDPFQHLPLQPIPPQALLSLEINGFGPSQYAFDYGDIFYNETRGLHTGIDFPVREGTPLIAVADGKIVDFRTTGDASDRSLALRPYLPERYRDANGARVLSNVIVVYGHLTGDPSAELVDLGEEVEAGQIIGTSGWPVYQRDDGSTAIQHNNAHLHIEVHLVTDGFDFLGNNLPFNPLMFWSPRLVAWQARLAMHGSRRPYPHEGQPYGRLGFFSIGAFRANDDGADFWAYTPTVAAPWPPGIYPLDELLEEITTWMPFPLDGSSAY